MCNQIVDSAKGIAQPLRATINSPSPSARQPASKVSGTLATAYRNFKPPFSRSATVSPSREAINHAVSGEDSPLSMTIRPMNRPELPDLDAR